MKATLDQGVKRVSEVVMFENWLRFYFISEEGGNLYLRLPEKAVVRLKESYPNLHGLAERLNNLEITHKRSLDAVCLFVASEIDGTALPETLIAQVFDHPLFHLELQLFSTWVQNHEEQLDAVFMEFNIWQRMYGEWRQSEDVQKHISSIREASKISVKCDSPQQ